MVVEMVEFSPPEGKEQPLVEFLAAARRVLEGLAGCRSVTCGRGVEHPSKVFLLVNWDSLEAHKAATSEPSFLAWRDQLIAQGCPATMQHFAVAG
jgi:heme-degrading monooxygenase HmoA